MQQLTDLLRENPYPGRGIVVGRTTAGEPCIYYWIMGRSANSRNRVFVRTDDGICTQAHDSAAVEDPSLIMYHPVRTMDNALVVTNGDQTDTIVEMGSMRAACMTRTYEPDEPNFTPRISAVVEADGSFELSILKRQGTSGRCLREFFVYEGCEPGVGYLITTYQGDGDPLPSFEGEPLPVTMAEPAAVWAALNEENKISLYAKLGCEVSLFNKNLGD